MQVSVLRPLLITGVLLGGFLGISPARPAHAQANPHKPQTVALEDSMLPVVARAMERGKPAAAQTIPIIVGLNFARPQEAAAYADAVSDSNSPLYRHFLTPEETAQRFAPSQAEYQSVVAHLQANGFRIIETPANRMSILAEATVAQAEQAFGTTLKLYREGDQDRKKRIGANGPALEFFANATPVRLPAAIAPLVQNVAGLENYVRAYPKYRRKGAGRRSNSPYAPQNVRTAYNTAPIYNAGMQGQNRTVAIISMEQTITSDTVAFVNHFSLPKPPGGAGANVTFVNVNGGAHSSPGGEANLDVQMVLGMAPLANVLIYNANYSFTNYLALVTKIVTDNQADIVTDSWGYTGTTSDYNQFHNQHVLMTTQGITYLNASGDGGSDIPGSLLYPETDPDILVVGGTVMTLNTQDHITNETGWYWSTGGYTDLVPFTRPAYQSGRGVPTTPNLRLLPDVAFHAGSNTGDSYQFYFYGQDTTNEGTSFASPICAGCLALVEQYLIGQNALPADSHGKQRLGRLNDKLYGFNGRNDVFRDTTVGSNAPSNEFPNGFSCTPYFDLVTGWGSLNFNNLAAALITPLKVTVSAPPGAVVAGTSVTLSDVVQGSNVTTVNWSVSSGGGSVNSSGVYTAPAVVTSGQTAVVRATSTIDASPKVYGETTLTLAPTALNTLALNPTTVPSGTSSVGTITLNGPAPPAGLSVTLSSDKPSVAQVGSSVAFSSGNTSKTFNITTFKVSQPTQVTISAVYNGQTLTATLTVVPLQAPKAKEDPVNPPHHHG